MRANALVRGCPHVLLYIGAVCVVGPKRCRDRGWMHGFAIGCHGNRRPALPRLEQPSRYPRGPDELRYQVYAAGELIPENPVAGASNVTFRIASVPDGPFLLRIEQPPTETGSNTTSTRCLPFGTTSAVPMRSLPQATFRSRSTRWTLAVGER